MSPSRRRQSTLRIDGRAPLAEHLDQALLLLDERVDAGGLAVEVVGDGALLAPVAAPEAVVVASPTFSDGSRDVAPRVDANVLD